MNDQTPYGDDEEYQDSIGKDFSPRTDRHELLWRPSEEQGTLEYLQPPPKWCREDSGAVKEDTEWGLGTEKSGNVDTKLQTKLAHFHDLKRQGTHFNESLAKNRSFRNPNIYSKLVEWVDVDETASAYSSTTHGYIGNVDDIWAASQIARQGLMQEAGSERIAHTQRRQQEMADEAKAKGRRSKVDFESAGTFTTQDRDIRSRKHARTQGPREEVHRRYEKSQSFRADRERGHAMRR